MPYYVTVHKDEEQDALKGEKLDACTTHMVHDTSYDLNHARSIIKFHPWKVLWEMERADDAKYGWRFKEIVQ